MWAEIKWTDGTIIRITDGKVSSKSKRLKRLVEKLMPYTKNIWAGYFPNTAETAATAIIIAMGAGEVVDRSDVVGADEPDPDGLETIY